MKYFTGKCLERYGLVTERPVKPQKSKRQSEFERLKDEKKALRRRWKSAKEDKKVGLSVLCSLEEDSKRKKVYGTRYSQAVTHPSTKRGS